MEASAGGIFWLGFFFATGCLTAYTFYLVLSEIVRIVLEKVLGRMME